jgi:phosphoesterase RecJ-like protein
MTAPVLTPPDAAAFAALTARIDAVPADVPVVLVTHFRPDGDAIGSLIAMGEAVRERGRRAILAVDDGVPDYLRFLDPAAHIMRFIPEARYPLAVALDASDEDRTGDVGKDARRWCEAVVNIDHHATNTAFGDLVLVNPAAVSTTEVVFDWMNAAALPLSSEAARALLTGLVTDTIGFRTPNVSPRTLAIAQTLMAAGVSLSDVIARTLNSTPLQNVYIWREALQTVRIEGGVIWATFPRETRERLGVAEASDAGLVSFLNTVNEARAALTFRETDEGTVSISMRSRPGVSVGAVALALGGGGHTQAAGVTLAGTLDAVVAQVVPLVQAAVLAVEAGAVSDGASAPQTAGPAS